MLRHKYIDRICCVAIALSVILAGCFVAAADMGLVEAKAALGYEDRLFDTSYVHEIDIRMENWDAFLETCPNEEYALCTVVLDGESYPNVAIRAKGNTSLSSVAAYGNDRYSFKVEFDHYDDALTYHGLDKLSLNNLIQDKTLMKDYLAYTLMGEMGVGASLCSYAKILVNGEYWGLYLAVEGVEDSFLSRNYGRDHGDLYKPDSMSFGGGKGNGWDFDMDAFRQQWEGSQTEDGSERPSNTEFPEGFDMPREREFPEGMEMPGGMERPEGMRGLAPEQEQRPSDVEGDFQNEGKIPSQNRLEGGGFSGRGMGSGDVKLQYMDDDPSSYSNIFDNAKTTVTQEDQQRLIASLKTLAGDDAASVVDVDKVIRYMAVHNFLCNDDSYTGQMIHNYYLYEENGVLSMIPWDYNLAFGGFAMGGSDATSAINDPIDYELSDRPMVAWIFAGEAYKEMYHRVYRELADVYLQSGWLTAEIDRVAAMIAPYVENDPTAFFTHEEFESAVSNLRAFCELRTKSILGQLAGDIPSTDTAQRQNSSALVDGSQVDLSAMGEFNMGGGGREMPGAEGGFFRNMPSFGGGEMPSDMTLPEGMAFPGGMEIPQGMDMPENMTPPGGMSMPQSGGPDGQMGDFLPSDRP